MTWKRDGFSVIGINLSTLWTITQQMCQISTGISMPSDVAGDISISCAEATLWFTAFIWGHLNTSLELAMVENFAYIEE